MQTTRDTGLYFGYPESWHHEQEDQCLVGVRESLVFTGQGAARTSECAASPAVPNLSSPPKGEATVSWPRISIVTSGLLPQRRAQPGCSRLLRIRNHQIPL